MPHLLGCKKFRVLAVLIPVALLSGCSAPGASHAGLEWQFPHARQATLTQSSDSHYQMAVSVVERDTRALIEDLDILFLMDRPSRLNRWHNR